MSDMERYALILWRFYCGKFGRYRLKEPYRRYWVLSMAVIHSFIFIRYVLFWLFGWWNGIVGFINFIIWG